MQRYVRLRMLAHKAWRESRPRFLVAVGVVGIMCAAGVLFQVSWQAVLVSGSRPRQPYSEHIYNFILGGTGKGVFGLLTLFLGIGGLLRERSNRVASFTLALPVSRDEILGTQVAIGLAQTAALALIPPLLIPPLSVLVGQAYPLDVALHFAVLWFVGGAVFYAATFMLSVMTSGEYTALIGGYLFMMAQAFAGSWGPLQRYRTNIFWTMGEFSTMHWNPDHTVLLPGPMPWQRLLVLTGLACALISTAFFVARRQDL